MLKTFNRLTKIGVGLMLLVYVDATFYYGSFNIGISQYIDISEVVLLLTGLGPVLLFLLALLFMISVMPSGNAELSANIMNGKFSIYESKTALIYLFASIIGVWILLIISIFWSDQFGDIILDVYFYSTFVKISFEIALIIALYLFYTFFTHKNSLRRKTVNQKIVIILLLVLTFILTRSQLTAVGLKQKRITADAEIYLLDESIKTNDSLIYVGGTRNFIFLYNLKSEKSTIIFKTNVKKINIKYIR